MIAIVEIDSERKVQSVKFSTDIAEKKSGNIHVINIQEPVGSPTLGFLNALNMLANNPFDLTVGTLPTGASTNKGSGLDEFNDGVIDVPSTDPAYDVGPYARNLDQSTKDSISVRPAAHRAGQTSFFGNI